MLMWKNWTLDFITWSKTTDNVSVSGMAGLIGFDFWIVFNIMLNFTILFFACLHLNHEKLLFHDIFIGRQDTVFIKVLKTIVYLFLAFFLFMILQDIFYSRWYDFAGQILAMLVALSYLIWFSAISRGKKAQKRTSALILKHKGKHVQLFFYLSFFIFLAGGSVCLFVLIGRTLHL
jgi:hypothetical protein